MPPASKIFTPRDAKASHPGSILHVEGSPGLRLQVGTIRKTWIYRYKDPLARMKQIKLGEWPAMGLAHAVQAWQDPLELRATGADPVVAKKAERARQGMQEFASMKEMLRDFMDHLDRVRQADSAKSARSRLTRLLEEEPAFAACKPSVLTRAMAYKIVEERSGYPAAAKVLRALLGQATERALDAGRVDPNTPNWWRLILHGKLRSKGKVVDGKHIGRAKRSLSEAELAQLLPWADGHMPQIHADITLLYLMTGLRGVEIVALREEYISEEGDGWWATFPSHMLKMERDRDIVDHRVPLVGQALEIVKRRIGQARKGWLFWTDRGGAFRPFAQSNYGNYLYDIQPNHSTTKVRRQPDAMCPVTKWSAHDLRRTARTVLSSMDCPHDVGEAILGHKQPVVAASYNLHTFDRQKRVWVPKLVARMQQLMDTSC